MAKHCCRICCSGCCYKENVDSAEDLIIPNEETQEFTPAHSVKSNQDPAATLTFPLPQPLLTGHFLFVEGNIQRKCTRFSVNLACGTEIASDKAMHFNPRLEEDYIVRNSCINDKWGEEEKWYPYPVKFTRPGKFKFSIFIAPDRFLISIDNKHYCFFKYRTPITRVSHLTVNGYVVVEAFYIKEATEYPSREIVILSTLPTKKPDSNDPLPIPYTAKLPENLSGKWQLEIIGKVKLLPQSFFVNIQEGMYIWPHPTIPLHFNPRFFAGEHIVIRNCWHNGTWGAETRGLSQFFPGQKFHLIIRWEEDEYSIWVNGKMTGMFRSKNREDTIMNTVHVQGDVVLYKVWVNTKVKSIIENMELYSKEVVNEEL